MQILFMYLQKLFVTIVLETEQALIGLQKLIEK